MQALSHFYYEIVSGDWNVIVIPSKVNYDVVLDWSKLCYDLRCSSARLGSVGRKFDIKLSVKNVVLCYTDTEELCHVSPTALELSSSSLSNCRGFIA